MKITFLGTNGWYSYQNFETSCVFVETKSYNLIFDLGSGIKNLNKIKYIKKPTYLFLSHLHLDHVIGVHYLNSIQKLDNLIIILNYKYLNFFRNIFNKPYTLGIKGYKFPIKILTFSKKKKPKIPINFEVYQLDHSDPSFGYKFLIDNKIISYCTDTKICSAIYKISNKSDLLILECNQLKKKNNYHLSFDEIKKNFNKLNAKKIALTHFGPEDFPKIEDRYNKLEKKLKFHYNNSFFITKDLDEIIL